MSSSPASPPLLSLPLDDCIKGKICPHSQCKFPCRKRCTSTAHAYFVIHICEVLEHPMCHSNEENCSFHHLFDPTLSSSTPRTTRLQDQKREESLNNNINMKKFVLHALSNSTALSSIRFSSDQPTVTFTKVIEEVTKCSSEDDVLGILLSYKYDLNTLHCINYSLSYPPKECKNIINKYNHALVSNFVIVSMMEAMQLQQEELQQQMQDEQYNQYDE